MRLALIDVIRRRLIEARALLHRPEMLVFLPALSLMSFWVGGERALLLLALGLPLVIGVFAAREGQGARWRGASGFDPDFAALDQALQRDISGADLATACLVVQFDNLRSVLDRHGRAAQREVLTRSVDRIRGRLRLGDQVAQLQGEGIAISLAPSRRLGLEEVLQLCVRLQEVLADPIILGGAQLYTSASIGFCMVGHGTDLAGRSLLDASQMAADEALRAGPTAIRAYSPEMALRHAARDALRDDVEEALERGEIIAYFQPQISTATGEISGMEALARWQHPQRGCLPPAEFLPAVESNDLSGRLGEVMLLQSLTALAAWDKAGLHVPSIAVNFSAAELRNPRLPDRIQWELDRFGLRPERLTIEILETVIAQTANDVIVATIARLAKLGCGIDLDDFGTGHASISTIRRFVVRRLKVDRSFISRIDEDREQQRMTAAIITLADRLGLATLAEGVETAGERAMLVQLGCGHVQGYGIARPMPLAETTGWIAAHQQRPDRIPRIGSRAR